MYSSYKNLFTIKWKIYSIGDRALPRPLPLDCLGLFLLMLFPSYLAALPLAHILGQARPVMTVILDAAAVYLLLQYDPQGRPFLIFIRDILAYIFHSGRKDLSGCGIPDARSEILRWCSEELNGEEVP